MLEYAAIHHLRNDYWESLWVWLQGDVAITTNKHAGWNWVAAEVPVMSIMGWVEALCSIWLFSAYKIRLEVVQKCCRGQRYPDHPRHMGIQSLFENLQWWTTYNSRKQAVPLFNSYSWSRNSSWLWVWISLKLSPLGSCPGPQALQRIYPHPLK